MKCRRTTWLESFSAVTGTLLRLSHGAMRQHVMTTSIQRMGEEMMTRHLGGSGRTLALDAMERRTNNAQNRPTAAHPQKRLATVSAQ